MSTSAEDGIAFLILGVGFVVVLAGLSLLAAWPVMVALGILHAEFSSVPDLSFWESFWVVWAWGVIWNRIKFTGNGD